MQVAQDTVLVTGLDCKHPSFENLIKPPEGFVENPKPSLSSSSAEATGVNHVKDAWKAEKDQDK